MIQPSIEASLTTGTHIGFLVSEQSKERESKLYGSVDMVMVQHWIYHLDRI